MIKVDPSVVQVPLVLRQKALEEREKATSYYSAPRVGKASFEFKLYRDTAIKQALALLFRGKCAYCESQYEATHPVDVEHWRPKGDVEEDDGTRRGTGYYWLAAEWANLLPSCIDCNRRREHVLVPTGERRVTGKGNFFPLDTPGSRATKLGEESIEKPLLLHPYHDDPAEALKVNLEDGPGKGALLPCSPPASINWLRAEASIRVYALNRIELVQARLGMLHQMDQHMYVIRQLLRVLKEELKPAVRNLVLDLVEHEMKVLHEFALPEQRYSLCARQALKEFQDELTGVPAQGSPAGAELPVSKAQ